VRPEDVLSAVRALRGSSSTAAPARAAEPRPARTIPDHLVSEPPLVAILGGEWHETEDGPVFVKDTWCGLDHRHGSMPLRAALDAPEPALREILNGVAEGRPGRLGFLDIETTGLSGGTGTYVFLAGLGTFEEKGFRLRQYLLADLGRERAMLRLLARDLREVEGIVTYNGRSFDVPAIETRMTLCRLPRTLAAMPHLDLLHPVRRICRHRLPGCSLVDAESFLLSLRRVNDVPGALIPAIYFDYTRAGRVAPLRGVLRHNGADILSMTGILARLAHLLASEDLAPEDAAGVARWCEARGDLERARRLYQDAMPHLDGGPQWSWAAPRYAMLLKRGGARAQAVEIWRRLWAAGDLGAAVEIAKYLEHEARDLAAAEDVARAALERAEEHDRPDVEHRLARIRRKLRRAEGSQAG